MRKAYGNIEITFGREYMIPKPFDPRVLLHVAPAVAKAAMDTGVARRPIENMENTPNSSRRCRGAPRRSCAP